MRINAEFVANAVAAPAGCRCWTIHRASSRVSNPAAPIFRPSGYRLRLNRGLSYLAQSVARHISVAPKAPSVPEGVWNGEQQ